MMKGIHGFENVLGRQREERAIRRDFNMAKKVGNIRYGKYYLYYPGIRKWMYIAYEDIVWAYRWLEEIKGRQARGGVQIHFLMLVTKDKRKLGVPVGEEENAVTGLSMLKEHSAYIDIGYAKEKEEIYL